MSIDQRNPGEVPPPHAQLIQMGTAYWISKVVYAAAKLGLADQLAAGPRSAAELAGPTRTHAPSLHRLMRTPTPSARKFRADGGPEQSP